MGDPLKVGRPDIRRTLRDSIKTVAGQNGKGAGPIVASIIAAAIMAGAGGYVSVQVMSAELDHTKADVHTLETTVRNLDLGVAAMGAKSRAVEQAEADRWSDIKRRLERIEDQNADILSALGRRDHRRAR